MAPRRSRVLARRGGGGSPRIVSTFSRTAPRRTRRLSRSAGTIGRAGLKLQQPRHALAMERRVTERDLRALGALEVEVQVVLPREADAAVDLDAVAGDLPVGVGDEGLCHRGGERPIGGVLVR